MKLLRGSRWMSPIKSLAIGGVCFARQSGDERPSMFAKCQSCHRPRNHWFGLSLSICDLYG